MQHIIHTMLVGLGIVFLRAGQAVGLVASVGVWAVLAPAVLLYLIGDRTTPQDWEDEDTREFLLGGSALFTAAWASVALALIFG
jgi:hypothetical protein